MEIQELWLKRYGKFENHRIRLKPGINIIYGGNETGKSTIHSFIRAMFFGLSRGRGRAAKTDEYQIRQPWDAPGMFLGSMRVQEGGEIYRIDRCFDRSTQPLSVTCETRAGEAKDPQRLLDALLGGMSEAAFANTVFIPQAHAETDEALAQELRRYMVNSDSTLDAQLDVTQALQTLRRKKKVLAQQKKKEEAVMEAQIDKKLAKADAVRGELELLKKHAGMRNGDGKSRGYGRDAEPDYGKNRGYGRDAESDYGKNRGYGRDADADDEEEWADEQEAGIRGYGKRILLILLLLAGILALAGAVLLTDWKIRVLLGVCGAVFLLLLFPVHFFYGVPHAGDREDERREEEESGGKRRSAYFREEIRTREEIYQRLQDELEELYHRHVRLDGTDTELAAVTMAIDRICELSSGIYAESGGKLNMRASEILRELTQGEYSRIILDESMEVRIHTPSRVLGLHQVSGGTMQQIYFALRMAAGELLCEGRRLPVILDETFAMYDDTRLEAALRWLKRSGRQVILFTCQKREREILERI